MIEVTYSALSNIEPYINSKERFKYPIEALEPLVEELGFNAKVTHLSSTEIKLEGGFGSQLQVCLKGTPEEMELLCITTSLFMRADEKTSGCAVASSQVMPIDVPDVDEFLEIVASCRVRLYCAHAAAMYACGVRKVEDIMIGRSEQTTHLTTLLQIAKEADCSFRDVYNDMAP